MVSADYVIVGGGLTGLALAVRLAVASLNVAVLEAGGGTFHDADIDIPGNVINNFGNPEKDWAFFSTPQKHLDGRQIYLPRGKGVGGSSKINVLEVTRPSKIHYDVWEKLGATGWNWDTLLSYIKKSETFTCNKEQAAEYGAQFDENVHGRSGPLHKTYPEYIDTVGKFWWDAVKAIGVPVNPDSNNGNNLGLFIALKSIGTNAKRSSSASAYYEPRMHDLPNLQVITDARVSRVLMKLRKEGEKAVAYAVEYIQDGQVQTINVGRGVILSAGAYQTPQVLELSGIGDPDILQKVGVPVQVPLANVGKNLQEHFTATYTAELTPGHLTWESLQDPDIKKEQEQLYATQGKGMYSTLPSVFAFLPSSVIDPDGKIASAAEKLTLDERWSNSASEKTFKLQQEWMRNPDVSFLHINAFDRFMPGIVATPEPGKQYMSSSLILWQPFSRGDVHITSSDPLATPSIDVNYLDNEVDTTILVEALKLTRRLVDSDEIKSHIAKEISPGLEYQTDEQLKDFLKKTIASTYHPIGTAGMLPEEDGGVVDAKLRVYGTENIRVADASIIPIHMSAHPQATLYGIAEMAADIIQGKISE